MKIWNFRLVICMAWMAIRLSYALGMFWYPGSLLDMHRLLLGLYTP